MNSIDKTFVGLICCILILLVSSCTKTEIQDPTSVTDIDGNVYPVIRIGNDLWMAENLRTTRYNDGNSINTGLSASDWAANTSGAYTYYDNNAANNTIYGNLYNWHAVNTGKLAPEGWRVATYADFANLIDTLGGSRVAGGKAKSTSSLWQQPNIGATNSSGFNGLPGGKASASGTDFTDLGAGGNWWCQDERNPIQGEYSFLINVIEGFHRHATNKNSGFSVRCVKN